MLDVLILSLCISAVMLAFKDIVLPFVAECAYIVAILLAAFVSPSLAYILTFARHARGCFVVGSFLDHVYHFTNLVFCILSIIFGFHTMYFAQQIVVATCKLWFCKVVGKTSIIHYLAIAHVVFFASTLFI